MLHRLRLKNFQAHEDRDIHFSPGLNVIVGPTDSGKSAVFRAIRWIAQHTAASGLITHGKSGCRAGLVVNDKVVTRFKDTKEYGYTLAVSGVQGTQQKFVACATQQPDEIRLAINLSEICFQGQHDSPYLLGMTPGQIAKEINKIVDLTVIDKSISTLRAWSAKAKTLDEAADKRLEKATAEAAKLYWVPEATREWEVIEALDARLAGLQDRVDRLTQRAALLNACEMEWAKKKTLQAPLEAAIGQIGILDGTLARNQARSTSLDAISRGIMATESLPAKIALASELEALVAITAKLSSVRLRGERLSGVAKLIHENSKKLESLQPLVEEIERTLTVLTNSDREVKENTRRSSAIDSILTSLKRVEVQLAETKAAQEVCHEALAKQQKEKPKCPACGRALD